MTEPNISVLMTSYNNENTIEEAINSVLNQTYKNITLFILDDYSIDNTYKIIKNIKNNNKNLKIFRNKKKYWLNKVSKYFNKQSFNRLYSETRCR